MFCFSGKKNIRCNPCEAAGQSEVEPVWKTLLQVKFHGKYPSCTHQACLKEFLSLSVRLLLLLYLLYIGMFTVCCLNRPLKDLPKNYTKSDKDKTIRIQKSLNVSLNYSTV